MSKTKFLQQQTEQIFSLLNEMTELIYVADMDTYELLFINQTGQERYHLKEFEGKKCYTALQGRHSPCPFCTNHLLRPDQVYTWEFTNELTQRHYLLKDKEIDWKGRRARFEVAVDVTAQEMERLALRDALDAEHMILECVRMLSDITNLDQSLQAVLKRIGEFFQGDRSYIFQIQNGKFSNTYEWCAANVPSQMQEMQNLDVGVLNYWRRCFAREQCMIISEVEETKEPSPEDYQALVAQEIKGLAAAPFERNGELVGFIGVDNPELDRVKHISSLFRTLSDFLGFAMRINDDEVLLTKMSFHDSLTGVFNRNCYMRDIELFAKQEQSMGIVYMDVNGLKTVNDQMGHQSGDQLLIQCVQKSIQVFREEELYRIGGDEFLIISRGTNKDAFISQAAQLRALFDESDSCSVAIGYKWAESSSKIQELTAAADAMMYEDKRMHYRDAFRCDHYHCPKEE